MNGDFGYFRSAEYNYLSKYADTLYQHIYQSIPIKKHCNIAVKLNLVGPFSPDKAITTHPEVLDLLLTVLSRMDCNIKVCEDIESEEFIIKTQIKPVLVKHGLEFHNLRDYGYININIDGKTYEYSSLILESDLFIQLPKFKNHLLTNYTGAIKNMYGCISYRQRKAFHKYTNLDEFSKIICSVYSIRKPDYVVMDAITAMDGFGPSLGDPIKLGYLIFGEDGVYIDEFITKLVGYDTKELAVLKAAWDMNLDKQKRNFTVNNNMVGNFDRKFVKLPVFHGSEYKKYFEILRHNYYINYERCVGCGICKMKCPFRAINMNNGFPVIDKEKCTMCTCCMEHCPENAINIKK